MILALYIVCTVLAIDPDYHFKRGHAPSSSHVACGSQDRCDVDVVCADDSVMRLKFHLHSASRTFYIQECDHSAFFFSAKAFMPIF